MLVLVFSINRPIDILFLDKGFRCLSTLCSSFQVFLHKALFEFHIVEMAYLSEKDVSGPLAPGDSPPRWTLPRRMNIYVVTPRKVGLVITAAVALYSLNVFFFDSKLHAVSMTTTFSNKITADRPLQPHRPAYLTENILYNSTILPNAAFQPPEALPHRYPDTIDTFASYKYRNTCNISSLDLHAPFAPLCAERKSLLTAMSSGGRIGHDAPYIPRGCDMRWFTTDEICEILSRFEKVIIVGDSMMRHVIGSLNVLIRKDLGYGAVTDWNFSPQERYDCAHL